MSTTVLIVILVLVALGVAGYFAWQRFYRPTAGHDDRYTPEKILTPEQVQMLDYLHDTFPDQVVLPNVALKDMLSVRRAADRRRAQQRLDNQKVDFAVCGEDGQPLFAFDVEQFNLSNAKAKNHSVKIKNRILKTAGVRFLFLKNGIHRMPSPEEFRKQLDFAALPRPKPAAGEPTAHEDSARQQLESRFSDFDQMFPTSSFRESDVMGLTGLMSLDEQEIERQSRQRPSTTARRR